MKLIGADGTHWALHRRALTFKVIHRQRGSCFTMRNMEKVTAQRGHRLSQKPMQVTQKLRLWNPDTLGFCPKQFHPQGFSINPCSRAESLSQDGST